MSNQTDELVQGWFDHDLARIPAPRPLRVAHAQGYRSLRLAALGALLLAVVGIGLAAEVDAVAAADGLSCADFGTKVRIWIAGLMPNPKGSQVGEVGGVPIVVHWSADRSALRVEAPTPYLMIAGCGSDPSSRTHQRTAP